MSGSSFTKMSRRTSLHIRFTKNLTSILSICACSLWVYGVYAKALIPMIIGAYYCFPGMHDASHGSAPNWVGHLTCIPLLVPFNEFKLLHRRHHAYTNDPEKDPDYITQTHVLSWFVIPEVYVYHWLRHDTTLIARLRGVASYVGMILLAVLLGGVWGTFRIFAASRIAFSALVYLLDVLPHRDCPPRSKGARDATCDPMKPAPLWFYILTAGQCYHEMHHFNPAIPWHQLKPLL